MTMQEMFFRTVSAILVVEDSNHDSSKGHYILGSDVTINSLSGSDTEALKQYVNMHLDSEGNPTNLTELDIRMENGIFKAEATGAGSVEKILYNGSETVPTVPGSYSVTCVMKFGEGTIELPIGTLVIPEPTSPGETAAPVEYRMQTSASEPVQEMEKAQNTRPCTRTFLSGSRSGRKKHDFCYCAEERRAGNCNGFRFCHADGKNGRHRSAQETGREKDYLRYKESNLDFPSFGAS